jgi:competence protein ComFC
VGRSGEILGRSADLTRSQRFLEQYPWFRLLPIVPTSFLSCSGYWSPKKLNLVKANTLFGMSHKLEGKWDEGFALELHTRSSLPYAGEFPGQTKFATEYTPLGALIRRCKYEGEMSAIAEVASIVVSRSNLRMFEAIIPVPPSNSTRAFQPVSAIAAAIGELTTIPVFDEMFEAARHEELKSISDFQERYRILTSAIALKRKPEIAGKKILVFDDVYRSGATLTRICDLLRPFAPSKLCVLTVTKTRNSK